MSNIDSNNLYENPNQNPENFTRWEYTNIKKYKEKVYDKISQLLIEKFTELESSLHTDGLENFQKTYKDGKLVTGKEHSDMLVIYESDSDANSDDKKIEDAIFRWLDFGDPEEMTIEIEESPSNLILVMPDRRFNMNEQYGELGIENVSIKDNVSQFLNLQKNKTNINRSKLSEFVDTEFSELSPITFTHLIEQYNKLKRQLPFYRYRVEDFFNEYHLSTSVPLEYRIEKFFEEFEVLKSSIPAGYIKGLSSQVLTNVDEPLIDYGTMTYLLKEIRLSMDDGSVPEFSSDQVDTFVSEINTLSTDLTVARTEIDTKDNQITQLNKLVEEFGIYGYQAKIEELEAAVVEQETNISIIEQKEAEIVQKNEEHERLLNEIDDLKSTMNTDIATLQGEMSSHTHRRSSITDFEHGDHQPTHTHPYAAASHGDHQPIHSHPYASNTHLHDSTYAKKTHGDHQPSHGHPYAAASHGDHQPTHGHNFASPHSHPYASNAHNHGAHTHPIGGHTSKKAHHKHGLPGATGWSGDIKQKGGRIRTRPKPTRRRR